MGDRSGSDLRVLHVLRCIGVAGAERLATAAGLDLSDTDRMLRELSDRGLVESDPGPFGGWSLTDNGRTVEQEMLDGELERARARDDVLACYESFMGLNPRLLEICSAWQMWRVGDTYIPNDHGDPDYDCRVLSRLVTVDGGAQRICADLARRLARFGVYGDRLAFALERVKGGDHNYVADNMDSYHTTWFQLHEDLLTTLGIPRDGRPA
ncbi:MAG: helix-turn-helix domain-containing protein [Acidimicrobiia bacterium]